jgi:hypothetical protein
MKNFYRYHADKGITLLQMQSHKSFNGGHRKEGLGENSVEGICCCDTATDLVCYLKGVMPLERWKSQGGEIVCFEGEYAEDWDCGDGVIAFPHKIVDRISISRLVKIADEE